MSTPVVAQTMAHLSPANSNSPRALQATCAADFPNASALNFLPFVAATGNISASLPISLETPLPLPKQLGALVPIGDQLGDVGQYYSQVAPSLFSTLQLSNTSPLTQTFGLKLFADTGLLARALPRCAIPPRSAFALQIEGGQIQLTDLTEQRPAQALCATEQRPTDPTATAAEPALHGIYHAEITTSLASAVSVAVNTEIDQHQQQTLYRAAGHYQAIAGSDALSAVDLPAVLVTRNQANWWDTEFVVQNTADQAAHVQFQLCEDAGHCFANNEATLQAHERRSFLASHLLYEDEVGFLKKRAGWFSATLTASAVEPGGQSPSVAVLANLFKQVVPTGAVEPKAEQGSHCLLQASAVAPAQRLTFTTLPTDTFMVRVYNPSATANAVTLQLTNRTGQNLRTLTQTLAGHGSFAWSGAQLFGKRVLQGPILVQLQAVQPLTAFAWANGDLLQAQETGKASAVWYAPLLGAPNVEFRWDSSANADPTRNGQPGSEYGIAESVSTLHVQRPDWLRSLNWYDWGANRQACDEAVADNDHYSTYIPMWGGLGKCGEENDRSCVNSPSRLSRIRNNIPSNCVGRPLFLANEPDLAGEQTFMTYHELGRMLYQLRSWPGELYSPVFASFAYAAPTYAAEPTEWCKEAVKKAWCPGRNGCAACIQDGIVDGQIDPNDISFKGLEDYFNTQDRWARGEQWRFEDVVEGMLLHFYSLLEPFHSAAYWRIPYLTQYRDRADKAGWPIIVTEYGFVVWPNIDGVSPGIDECMIATHVDDVRQVLQKYLGNYQAEHNFNPRKIFWFHTGCALSPSDPYTKLCLFQTPATLSSPVGLCWYKDAVSGGTADRTCDQPCAQNFLPFITH